MYYDYISHSKPTLALQDKNNVDSVIDSGMVIRGEKVTEFEKKVSQYLGLQDGVAVSSGSSGIFLALKALDIKEGDEVILPTYVCPTVLFATRSAGAVPVLCDTGPNWNIDYTAVKPHLNSRTRAIIAPHIGGIPVDIEPIIALGIPVIEDLAQAFGAEIQSRKVGTFGRVAVCSFQAIKCITTGEGGMVLSNDKNLIGRVREWQILSPMNNIQAALGLSQLARYPFFLERRRQIAEIYFKAFDRFAGMCMPVDLRSNSIFYRFPLRINAPFTRAQAEFEEKQIAVRQFIDSLLHRNLGLSGRNFPNAERCFAETLSIPIYPALTDSQVNYVAEVGRQLLPRYNTVSV